MMVEPLYPWRTPCLPFFSSGYSAPLKPISRPLHFTSDGISMQNVSHLRINGKAVSVDADPSTSLLNVLREDLDLIGSKYGCGEGQCGACTVLIDGVSRRSCITSVGSVVGKEITTIEGLARGEILHPLQEAFLEEEAMQCAYCTSGMIMSAASLLLTKANPSEAEIIQHMQGNICRCGTYPRIISAIQKAARKLQGGHA
jgi:aerobic-type carbon monoxide dehydrogenase small subunit (CoxS/CutS family)